MGSAVTEKGEVIHDSRKQATLKVENSGNLGKRLGRTMQCGHPRGTYLTRIHAAVLGPEAAYQRDSAITRTYPIRQVWT